MSRQAAQKVRTPGKQSRKAKAQYGPVPGVPATRAGFFLSRQLTRGSQGITSEGRPTDMTPGTTVTNVIPTRMQYVAPPEYNTVGLMTSIQNYLDKTGLEKNFFQLLHFLLEKGELPYNPYPEFVIKLRPYAERFIMHSDTDDQVDHVTTVPLRETSVLNLYTVKGAESVWGLKSMLRTVNVGALHKYRWLVEDITPKQGSMFQKEGYSTQVMAALVGAAVFQGSFFAECHIIQVRLEYLVTGPDLATGVEIFMNSIMLDIDCMARGHTVHILLGLNVPVEVDEVWEQQFWDLESISDEKATLLQFISNAVSFCKNIIAECVFKLDLSQKNYMRGQKQYCLNFITVVENNLKEEGLQSFAEFPMGSLHEGVFLNQTQAEAYISIFTPQTSAADIENIKRTSARPAKVTSKSQGDGGKRPSMVIEDDRTLIHRHVHARLELMRPTKIRIDGFRMGEDAGFGPFAWQITSPIKSNLQKRIAGFHLQAQLFDIVYHALLLSLMDRSSFDASLVRELYRLCHGTAGRLHMLGEQNKALRGLIRGLIEMDELSLIRMHLQQYSNSLDEVLAHSLHDRSTEFIAVGQAMVAEVKRLLQATDFDISSTTYIDHIVSTLRSLHSFSTALAMELAEDSLQWCPHLKEMITKLHQTFPEEVLRPQTQFQDQAAGTRLGDSADIYKHGMEDEQIRSHEHTVINRQMCMEKENSPQIIRAESVLIKYVIDTHLDDVWHSFLVNLQDSGFMPANPYPQFLSLMRGCCMKMDLFFEKESTLENCLMTSGVYKVDANNFVFQVPGCEAFGPESAVMMVDPGAYVGVVKLVEEHLTNRSYIHRKGPYKVGICLGMVAPSTLYGKMCPYLHSIELHEHYYIQGPLGCEADARQLFGRMVQAHVAEMIDLGNIPVHGVLMGNDKVRWSWVDVINKREGFWNELEMTCARKEPVLLKGYIKIGDWRYLRVNKHFLLHFITDDSLENTKYFPENPAAFYKTVFFSKERAAFHYQNDGPPRGGNPNSAPNAHVIGHHLDKEILTALEGAKWFAAYGHLLLKSLITKSGCGVAAAAWRMFHSVAGQAAYVASLCESLQDLIQLTMEYAEFSSQSVPTAEPQSETTNERQTYVSQENPSPISMEVVNQLAAALYHKAMLVCRMQVAMLPQAMPDYMEGKLRKTVIGQEPTSGHIFLIVEYQTIETLEEIKQIFLGLAAMTGGDLHSVCTHATAAMLTAQREISGRPLSVASQSLVDPDRFRRSRPRATKKILEDELLYG